jgi:hypothetical protein
MVGRSIADDSISNIIFLRGVIWRDPNGFEDLLASDNSMCPVGRDVQGRDSDACFMGDGLRFPWALHTNIIRNQNFQLVELDAVPRSH